MTMPAAATAPTTAKRTTYHHGTLKEALVDAADAIIRERGLEGFSLREATRRAGVSPGAPKHHFGGIDGLLTEVAIRAFAEQARYMEAVPVTGSVAVDLRASVLAYVSFAIANPGHYRLMFRNRLLGRNDRLDAAAEHSLERMAPLMAAYDRVDITSGADQAVAPGVIASLATAHGLAHYALEHPVQPADSSAADLRILGTRLADVLVTRWPDRDGDPAA